MKKIKQKASKKRSKNLKVYKEKVSAWTQLEAVNEFKSNYPDRKVLKVSVGTNPHEAWKKPTFTVTYEIMKAKYRCIYCSEKIFGQCALVNKKRIHNKCYNEYRRELQLKQRKQKDI